MWAADTPPTSRWSVHATWCASGLARRGTCCRVRLSNMQLVQPRNQRTGVDAGCRSLPLSTSSSPLPVVFSVTDQGSQDRTEAVTSSGTGGQGVKRISMDASKVSRHTSWTMCSGAAVPGAGEVRGGDLKAYESVAEARCMAGIGAYAWRAIYSVRSAPHQTCSRVPELQAQVVRAAQEGTR